MLSEAAPGFEPGMEDLQSSALPLGHAAEGARCVREAAVQVKGLACVWQPFATSFATGCEP